MVETIRRIPAGTVDTNLNTHKGVLISQDFYDPDGDGMMVRSGEDVSMGRYDPSKKNIATGEGIHMKFPSLHCYVIHWPTVPSHCLLTVQTYPPLPKPENRTSH